MSKTVRTYGEKAKAMDELIRDGILNAYDADIDIDDASDWQGAILRAVNKTGQSFNRLERIGIMEICRGIIPDFSEENIEKLVQAIVEGVSTNE